MNIDFQIKSVENALNVLIGNAKYARTDIINQWKIHRGNADILLFIRESSIGRSGSVLGLSIVSPICMYPAEPTVQNIVFSKILELNYKLVFEKFCIEDDIIYLQNFLDLSLHKSADIAKRVEEFSILAAEFFEFFNEKKEAE